MSDRWRLVVYAFVGVAVLVALAVPFFVDVSANPAYENFSVIL